MIPEFIRNHAVTNIPTLTNKIRPTFKVDLACQKSIFITKFYSDNWSPKYQSIPYRNYFNLA